MRDFQVAFAPGSTNWVTSEKFLKLSTPPFFNMESKNDNDITQLTEF